MDRVETIGSSDAPLPVGTGWWKLFAVAMLTSTTVHLLVFHPYYFGDELFNFAMADSSGGGFLETFAKLNSYKPRLLFNGWWALISTADLSRFTPMLISAAFLAATLAAACVLVQWRDRKAFLLQIVLVLVIVTCRFGAMLPFDYVASIIEFSSLAFFLFGLVVLTRAHFLEQARMKPGLLALALFAAAIFSHERYVAAVLAVGGVIGLMGLLRRRPEGMAWGVILGGLGPLAFVALSKMISVVSLSTGTAGLSVTLGHDTLKAAGIYLGNLFLATSQGHSWFFAKLPAEPLSTWLVAITGVALLGWSVDAVRRRKCSDLSLYLFVSMLALLMIACLPGTGRQEARWLFPAFVLFAVMVATHGTAWVRLVMLGTMLVANVAFLQYGSPEKIYNIVASSQARDLSLALNHVKAPGAVGLLIGEREPDVSWMLGGGGFGPGLSTTPGVQFSRINLPEGVHVFRAVDDAKAQLGLEPDFGVKAVGSGSYAFMTQRELRSATTADVPPLTALHRLGGDGAWQEWTLRGLATEATGELYLTADADGFLRVPVQQLEGRRLVYRMSSLSGRPVQARLQVNWMAESDRFLSAAIQVVDVGEGGKDYAMFLAPPVGAKDGLVYVTLAASNVTSNVHVEFVGIEP
ncbi:hypothetical protein [Pseudoxanthomonas sp. Root630]|uniref:hypothetical protein n=1 Tax=Pseudoxanthomonas sp. Root630 TaxID=1736574 RepID=UPI0012DD3CC3|nr:hypothetical protein [Pseudoxanthomonas sp. Root630]